jgi:MinD superfamily P-loop ATPase
MLKYYGAVHLSRGVRVGIHCPWISHLLFADDCMVFTQATIDGATRLQEILERYRIGSGQMVNK